MPVESKICQNFLNEKLQEPQFVQLLTTSPFFSRFTTVPLFQNLKNFSKWAKAESGQKPWFRGINTLVPGWVPGLNF